MPSFVTGSSKIWCVLGLFRMICHRFFWIVCHRRMRELNCFLIWCLTFTVCVMPAAWHGNAFPIKRLEQYQEMFEEIKRQSVSSEFVKQMDALERIFQRFLEVELDTDVIHCLCLPEKLYICPLENQTEYG